MIVTNAIHRCLSMVSDFFYPNMGGVENHVFTLSRCLLERGHKVIVITHAYDGGNRVGVRWMSGGLKVYYLPIPVMVLQCTWLTVMANVSLLYSVLVRERIQHLHGHQVGSISSGCQSVDIPPPLTMRNQTNRVLKAFSNLAHEAIMHARTMGIPCTFTDHSLFGFADAESILMNKALKFTLSDVENIICVSNTSKENTVLRAALDPTRVHVIPNAISSPMLTPDPSKRSPTNGIFILSSPAFVYTSSSLDIDHDVFPLGG